MRATTAIPPRTQAHTAAEEDFLAAAVVVVALAVVVVALAVVVVALAVVVVATAVVVVEGAVVVVVLEVVGATVVVVVSAIAGSASARTPTEREAATSAVRIVVEARMVDVLSDRSCRSDHAGDQRRHARPAALVVLRSSTARA
jgi:type IV secretory pathway TrbL component